MIFYIGESSNGRTAAGAKSRLKLGDRLMVGLHPLKVAMNVRIVLPQFWAGKPLILVRIQAPQLCR